MNLITQELERQIARHLESMKNHVLERPEPNTYLMRKPGTMMFCVYITFTPFGTVIGGDFCPGRHGVISSGWRYGLKWFIGDLGADYLAEKFLSEYFTADLCHVEAKSYLQSERKELANWLIECRQAGDRLSDCKQDSGYKYHRTYIDFYNDLLEYDRHELSPERIRDAADRVGLDLDSCPGHGYDINDQADLVAIQRKFRELYLKRKAIQDAYKYTVAIASGKVVA